MQKKFSLKNNRLAKTIIISGSILIVVAFVILRYQGFLELLSDILRIFRPIIIGCVLAFALNRPMNFFQVQYRRLFAWVKMKHRHRKRIFKKAPVTTGRAPFVLACLTTYIVTIAAAVGIVWFVIPQIYDSVILFGDNLNDYISNFEEFLKGNRSKIENVFGSRFNVGALVERLVTKLSDAIGQIAEHIPDLLEATMNITTDIISLVVDLFIGIVFSVYILLDKEKLKKSAKKVTRIVIKGERYKKFEKITGMAYTTFSNFISGQLIEAAILGVLCFVGMNLLGFQYPLLISVIIGVLNMIPIAGPIIGTIPGALIQLMIEPVDALWFVIFVIVIQQIDSNFIYPKVVGNKVGLPPLWVLFAITIGGGFGGVMGMILGVPVLSIVYALISEKLSETDEEKLSDTNVNV